MDTPGNIPVFIISLDRAVERREYMKQLLANLGVEATFVSAVHGRYLSEEQQSRYSPALAKKIYGCAMTANEIGCYLSHYGVYERIAAEGIETALIIEDDIDCAADLRSVIEELASLPSQPSGWQVVRLMSSKSSVQRPRNARAYGARMGKVAGRDLCRLQSGILGGCAYVIRKSAAEAMLKYARTIFMPIDQALDRYWENGIVPFVLRPMPVWHSTVFESEIGMRGRAIAGRPALRELIRRRMQRMRDAFAKRVFWAAFGSPLFARTASLAGLRSARMALRALSGLTDPPARIPSVRPVFTGETSSAGMAVHAE